MALTVADYGEKRLIAEVVRPLFDGGEDISLLGDDCVELSVPLGHRLLLSTDRVPADLIAFQLGVIDHIGLGQYIAYLNLSDIIASGGIPAGLLLTMGIPPDLSVDAFTDICRGAHKGAAEYGCRVVGGDISGSAELSLSATGIGFVPDGERLSRNGARPGDAIFVSKPLGMTPAAFASLLGQGHMETEVKEALRIHLADARPSLVIGRALARSGWCSACMDNTDGIGQSLAELAAESSVAFIIEAERVELPDEVQHVASKVGIDPLAFALGSGHDLGLVGTLAPVSSDKLTQIGLPSLQIIGYVDEGTGLYLEQNGLRSTLDIPGWDYFKNELPRKRDSTQITEDPLS